MTMLFTSERISDFVHVWGLSLTELLRMFGL
ncbi:hypothetical protein Cocul_00397 [Corynebacterium oculi]|uniref:Uncharacterized protein n=1 Tax=Corynebacterium oculi TaxID=1544416 RepID=A0A0Q1AF15_9CORY|nr:hypothetical protein Cocul_00397 [Corynebacterium oculi]